MSRPLHIIVADDEAELRRYYRAIVTRLGHDVVAVVEDGNELLDACSEHHPDIVITDIAMPNLNGLDAIHRSHPDQRFIIISGQDKMEAEEKLDAQILVRLTKPIDKSDIAEALDKVLIAVDAN